MTLTDAIARQQALDVTQSFIVQAPAGSGKTELLTQRFLALLATVQQPEEIIALTFTRKAAQEMRQRIHTALQRAATQPLPTSPHQQLTWQLATQVLAHQPQWQLLDNPNRLRVQTLDSLCAALVQQMPVQCRSQVNLSDEAYHYYHLAVHQLLQHTQTNSPWYPALKTTLLHLDNRWQHFQSLCADMLATRDQWLPYITQTDRTLKQQLELGLQHVIQEHLEQIALCIPPILITELVELTRHAANQVTHDHPLYPCRNLDQLPGTQLSDRPLWLGITELLLTQSGQWRKSITKTQGFPPGDSRKADMLTLLEQLYSADLFRCHLLELRYCPTASYTTSQWDVVQALTTLLPLLAAQLKLVFHQHNITDFIEVATLARDALGHPDAPTDLALSLDYKIQHLLVDEFQDTSISQYDLLTQLTAGWQKDDGRTLFLVGDPMQSIYRFRKAEVGLFLRAQAEGIGQLPLHSLVLSSNFRSIPALVHWFNHVFGHAFPDTEDVASGAIPYSPAEATLPANEARAVYCHNLENYLQEAHHLVETIQICQQQHPQATIAVLTRSRHHLMHIIPALQQANIAYQATDITPFQQTSIVQDLWSLTRGLLHPAERLAWLSILRAPWCGLTLADLTYLAEADPKRCLFDHLQDPTITQQLSADGQQRLQKIIPILVSAYQQRLRQPLAIWVEQIWRQLDGPACLTQAHEQQLALTFFNLLTVSQQGEDIADWARFQAKLANAYCTSQPAHQLHLMTIHKAKGLEFDIVIIPGLARIIPDRDTPLLIWQERPGAHGENDLLLAPLQSAAAQHDSIYHYLRHLEKKKTALETSRLLYVAATRAKQQLHLYATVAQKNDNFITPSRSSLLSSIWQATHDQFTTQSTTVREPEQNPSLLKRLPKDWFAAPRNMPTTPTEITTLPIIWESGYAHHLGTLMHLQLKQLAEEGLTAWSLSRLQVQQLRWQTILLRLGVPAAAIPTSLAHIQQTFQQILDDPIAHWILNPHHLAARCEYALTTTVFNQQPQQIIIDRTFIDQGIRWIIDYKTTPKPVPSTSPLYHQHRQQLYRYAQAMQTIEQHPIRLGLYYPVIKAWYPMDYPN